MLLQYTIIINVTPTCLNLLKAIFFQKKFTIEVWKKNYFRGKKVTFLVGNREFKINWILTHHLCLHNFFISILILMENALSSKSFIWSIKPFSLFTSRYLLSIIVLTLYAFKKINKGRSIYINLVNLCFHEKEIFFCRLVV